MRMLHPDAVVAYDCVSVFIGNFVHSKSDDAASVLGHICFNAIFQSCWRYHVDVFVWWFMTPLYISGLFVCNPVQPSQFALTTCIEIYTKLMWWLIQSCMFYVWSLVWTGVDYLFFPCIVLSKNVFPSYASFCLVQWGLNFPGDNIIIQNAGCMFFHWDICTWFFM
jgi:hypothetical protein